MLQNVLIVHCRYKQTGGEEAVVAREAALLKNNGHQVTLLELDNADLTPASTLMRSVHFPQFWRKFNALIAEKNYHILHAHNLWPQAPISLFAAAKKQGMATLHSQHNYRAVCANGLMLRHGQHCELCLSHGPQHAFYHRCYRQSYAASLFAIAHHKRYKQQVKKHLDLAIALNQKAKSLLLQTGFLPHKVTVKSNFVGEIDQAISSENEPRRGCLFVGRFAPEKGVELALEAAHKFPQIPFTFIGDGPLFSSFAKNAPANVTLTGWLSQSEIAVHLKRAKLLLLPSQYTEGMPMVALEAMVHNLPILALDHIAFAADQAGQNTITLANSSDVFLHTLATLYENDEELAQRALNTRRAFAHALDEKLAYQALMNAYDLAEQNARYLEKRHPL